MPPAPFYDLLEQSVALYDAGAVQGFYLFAGSVLQNMNASLWAEWDLPGHLAKSVFPWVGAADVTVIGSPRAWTHRMRLAC